jgi:hypothetical protein
MHQNRRAVAWTTFVYPTHMERVQRDDLVFMFAKGVGLIGVGRATGPRRVPRVGHPDRIANESGYQEEWQVPVVWLRWEPDNPCVWDLYPNTTFLDISGRTWTDRLQNALRHFGL